MGRIAQFSAHAGHRFLRQQEKSLVAVLHGTRVEIRHLSAHRRAAVRLPRLRRKGEHNTRARRYAQLDEIRTFTEL